MTSLKFDEPQVYRLSNTHYMVYDLFLIIFVIKLDANYKFQMVKWRLSGSVNPL